MMANFIIQDLIYFRQKIKATFSNSQEALISLIDGYDPLLSAVSCGSFRLSANVALFALGELVKNK